MDDGCSVEKQNGLVERLASVSKQLNRFTSGLDRGKSVTGQALKELKFTSKNDDGAGWTAVEKRFVKFTATTDDGLLLRSKFGECIGMNSKEFALELFDGLARRRNITGDVIDKEQLKEFWEQINDQSFDSRLKTFFDMMDKDGNGRLTKDEVREIINLCSSASNMSTIERRADEYAAMIMEVLDPNNMGYIMMESFKTLLVQAETKARVLENSERRKKLSERFNPRHYPSLFHELRFFVLDNWQRIWVIALWLAIMVILFMYKYIQYKNRAVYQVLGHCVCMAKGAAETLKVNMALIMLPVCRNTITWLRNWTRLGVLVPFDESLNFHKVIAVGITIAVGIHSVAHLACDFPRQIAASPEAYMPLEKFYGEEQPKRYLDFVKSIEGITGFVMVLLITIAFTLSTPWFRQGKLLKKLANFNAFWYTHHLFVIVYILLVLHGYYLHLVKEWYKKTTWMYLAVPVALYACERSIRAFRSSFKTVTVVKVMAYPENVLTLQMSKPKNFKYKSGQYMFVKCPAVSPFEWHPFSITSAPHDDYLSVHIKILGGWTNALKGVLSEVSKLPPPVGDMLHGQNNPNFPKIMIDGPYCAAAQDYKKYKVVLLVGLGIGAAPMISIIKDIINNRKAEEEAQINQMEKGSQQERDRNNVIELHNYCTSVNEKGDAHSTLIRMLQSLNHSKNCLDILSGTRVMSHFAKPNWKNIFKQIAIDHPHSNVGVFYCGPPALTKELKHIALELTQKTSTRFSFHKESFF